MSDIQESGQMYLETILILKEKNENVRAIDIANEMNFSKPSVSRGMKILKENNLITIDDNGFINFTKQGEKIAKSVYEKHKVISSLLIKIGVDKKTAIGEACKIEHVLSDETLSKIKKYFKM